MTIDELDSSEQRPSFEYDACAHYHSNLDFLNNNSQAGARIPINEKIFQEIKPKVSEPFYKPPQH